jgi:hypothetical protein
MIRWWCVGAVLAQGYAIVFHGSLRDGRMGVGFCRDAG